MFQPNRKNLDLLQDAILEKIQESAKDFESRREKGSVEFSLQSSIIDEMKFGAASVERQELIDYIKEDLGLN